MRPNSREQFLIDTIKAKDFADNYYKSRISFKLAVKIARIIEFPLEFAKRLRDKLRKPKRKLSPKINVKVEELKELKTPNGRVAVFIHLYYPDLIEELNYYLENIPTEIDLYVNIPNEVNADISKFTIKPKKIYRLENIGKDMSSFIFFLQSENLFDYYAVLKLHSKKSERLGVDEGILWRKGIFQSLLGSKKRVNEILNAILNDGVGIVGVKEYFLPFNRRLKNYKNYKKLLSTYQLNDRDFGYHAGGMFWFSPNALKPIIDNKSINFDSFRNSQNQNDGDLEHAFERIFDLCSKKTGHKTLNVPIFIDPNEVF